MNNVTPLKKATAAATAAASPAIAWAKANRGAIAIVLAISVVLIAWKKYEDREAGGPAA